MIKVLRPGYFLLGILLGFIFCCIAGHFISHKARLNHFTRFYLAIEPQTLYYPTASELLQTVIHKVPKDKILVLIGGSSILRGDGQNPDELWSNRLQELLGDKYKVINFASDGASFSSFGGVVFRMLREIYPKIIFVAAAYEFNSEGSLDGLPPYDYLFWDAYYKKLFHPYPNELTVIKRLQQSEMHSSTGLEQHLMSFLDSYLYFRNLWNWVGYRFMFTMFSEFEFSKPFKARHTMYDDPIPLKYQNELVRIYHDDEHFQKNRELMEKIVHDVTDFSKNPAQVRSDIIENGKNGYNEVFSAQDRKKILMVQTTYNTQVIASLPKKLSDSYWLYTRKSTEMLQSLGYNSINVGKNVFSNEDYKDLDHLRATGGNKLAMHVAKEVKLIAQKNKYLT
jgi:hypothetical protein